MDRRSVLGLVGASASAGALAACGSSSGSGSKSGGTKTIKWWHIATKDPGKSLYQQLADQFAKDHSGVKFEVTPIDNDAFKTKIATNIQSGNPPDIFHTWGGGVLADQVTAGQVKDITGDIAAWKDSLIPASTDPYSVGGKVYGAPIDTGMVGLWYNKELFTKANITALPQTWADLLDAVRKLKAAGITPIALDGKDKWPGHYWWAYLALRITGLEGLAAAAKSKDFSGPDFVAAGQRLKELADLQPFQKGWQAAGYDTPDGEEATMGNGAAGFELMGQWSSTVQKTSAKNQVGLGDKLGYFAFPAVDGGKGKITDAFGGGGGFAIGHNAPPEALEFVKFLSTPDIARQMIKANGTISCVSAANDAVTDPNLLLVESQLKKASGFQLYLDQAYPPAWGEQIKDSVAQLLEGQATPDQVAKAITNAAKQG